MQNADYLVVSPGFLFNYNPDFPFAPPDWSMEDAVATAQAMKIDMNDDKWDIVRALQEYYAKHERIRVRELLDALDEKFHFKGGARFLLRQFPGGPINQGSQIAGLSRPVGSKDTAYGTVR